MVLSIDWVNKGGVISDDYLGGWEYDKTSHISLSSSRGLIGPAMFQSTTTKIAADIRLENGNTNSTGGAAPSRPNRYAYAQSKAGGDISDAFSSLAGAEFRDLPARYAGLKRTIVPTKEDEDSLVTTWVRVLTALKPLVAEIKAQGSKASTLFSHHSSCDL